MSRSLTSPAPTRGVAINLVSCQRLKRPLPLLLFFYLLLVSLTCINHNQAHADDGTKQRQDPELEIHDVFKPEFCDRTAKSTDVLTLHYKGQIRGSQTAFDSSYARNEPLTFQLGIGQVIKGWERGLVGVCVGEKRKLVIPPHLGYGNAKHDQIPPGSTLVFEIEVLRVEEGPMPQMNVFKEIDVDMDGRLSRNEMGEFLKRQLSQMNQHGDSGTTDDPDQIQMVDEIFMQEDRDKDGYITHDEFSGPKHDHEEL